jgi:hypothetical protein
MPSTPIGGSADLEQRGARDGQLTRSTRAGPRLEFGEVGKLQAEIGKLKSEILKLKAALQEEPTRPSCARRSSISKVEMASLRQAMKRIAKERDGLQLRVQAYKQLKHKDVLTRKNHDAIIKALHPNRSKHVKAS